MWILKLIVHYSWKTCHFRNVLIYRGWPGIWSWFTIFSRMWVLIIWWMLVRLEHRSRICHQPWSLGWCFLWSLFVVTSWLVSLLSWRVYDNWSRWCLLVLRYPWRNFAQLELKGMTVLLLSNPWRDSAHLEMKGIAVLLLGNPWRDSAQQEQW